MRVLLVLLALSPLALAQEVEELVRRLGDESWEVREAASQALFAGSEACWPALLRAKTDRDPEVAGRAAWLLDRIEEFVLCEILDLLELRPLPGATSYEIDPRALWSNHTKYSGPEPIEGPTIILDPGSDADHMTPIQFLARAEARRYLERLRGDEDSRIRACAVRIEAWLDYPGVSRFSR